MKAPCSLCLRGELSPEKLTTETPRTRRRPTDVCLTAGTSVDTLSTAETLSPSQHRDSSRQTCSAYSARTDSRNSHCRAQCSDPDADSRSTASQQTPD